MNRRGPDAEGEATARESVAGLLRPAFTVLFFAMFGVAYLLLGSFRAEVDRAIGVLVSGDIEAFRDYILS